MIYKNFSSGNDINNDNDTLKLRNNEDKDKETDQQRARKRLSALLSSLDRKQGEPPSNAAPVKLAKPREKFHSKRLKAQLEQQLASAAEKENSVRMKEIGPELESSIRAVAKEVKGGHKTESQLLDSLKQWMVTKDEAPVVSETKPQQSLSDLLGSLTVSAHKEDEIIRIPSAILRKQSAHRAMFLSSLGDAQPLGIFTPLSAEEQLNPPESVSYTPTWDAEEMRELKRIFRNIPPANQFQEFIRWTEDGKIWKFPIDNEQGCDIELDATFADHIFLDHKIESWCPKTGPLAKFMGLVVVGLGKNPFITLQRKHEVLDWYRDFFAEKMHYFVDSVEEGEDAGESVAQ